MATKSLDVVVAVRDRASKKFGLIGRSAMGMEGLIKRAAVGVGVYFGARQIASIVKYGAAFEQTMSRVKALTSANEAEHRQLTETAKKLGETTAFTAKQVADGMSYLALAGFETNEIIASMPATLDLAAAGQIDLAQATDITAKIMRGMGLDTNELNHAVDVLAKGFTTANTDLIMLGDAFSYVGPIARTAGISLEEVTSTIQVMSNAGIQASMAGTSLRQILGVLSGASAAATAKLDKLGIKTRDAAGNLAPMADIVDQLNASMADMGRAEQTGLLLEIFGKRAGPGMAALLNEGSEALRKYETDLENAAGTAKRIADTQLDNVAGELTKIGSVASGIILSITTKTQGWLKDYLARFRAGLSVLGVVINNAGLVWDIFWTKAKLLQVSWWEDTKHLFGVQVPELLKWFGRNWREIFTDLWNMTKAIFVNMAKNVGNFFKGVWSWLKGDGFDFKWTGLLEGFESTLTELPKIAKRGLTATEKALRKELDDMKLKFAQKIVDKFETENADIQAAAKKAVAKIGDIEDEERKKTAKAMQKGALAAIEARFLTFAPGTQLNYQKLTADNTAKQIKMTQDLIDATKANMTKTTDAVAKAVEKPESTGAVEYGKTLWGLYGDVMSGQKGDDTAAKTLEKGFQETRTSVNKQIAAAAAAQAHLILQKSIRDAFAKRDKGEPASANTARQITLSEQMLNEQKGDKTADNIEKNNSLTSKIVDQSKKQTDIAKQTLTAIKELAVGGETIGVSNFN